MRPRPPTFTAHATRLPATERPIGVDDAFATACTLPVLRSAARIERPTRNTIAEAPTARDGDACAGGTTDPDESPVWTSYQSRARPSAERLSSARTLPDSAIASGVP